MSSDTSKTSQISIDELLEKFSSGTTRQRKALIQSIEDRADEIALIDRSFFNAFDRDGDDWCIGWILQVIHRHQPQSLKAFLPSDSNQWFQATSSVGIDYEPLQRLLLEESFEEADRFTSAKLRQLAGTAAEARGYVYYSEVEMISGLDLITIDRLWKAYSQGRFGFSVQGRLLDSLKGRYEFLWPRIGWKKDGEWTRYPISFDWSIEAPEGHMPLVNQLRGVRLMDAILNHPSIISRR